VSTVAPCVACGHGADEHRLEGVGISWMPTTASVEVFDKVTVGLDVPRAIVGPFRCVIDGCGCLDYVDEPKPRKG
jgi:hypothetical protein